MTFCHEELKHLRKPNATAGVFELLGREKTKSRYFRDDLRL